MKALEHSPLQLISKMQNPFCQIINVLATGMQLACYGHATGMQLASNWHATGMQLACNKQHMQVMIVAMKACEDLDAQA